MSVAAHLNIRLDEYDARIRTFVRDYDELIATAANALRPLPGTTPTIVDLGIGTGKLAARCLEIHPAAELVGVDDDPAMLEAARARLSAHPRLTLVRASFQDYQPPSCDALVACLALHHIPTPEAKQAFYARCSSALRPGGMLVSADCFPDLQPELVAQNDADWLAHLERHYPHDEAVGYLDAWSEEDFYFSLDEELAWLGSVGLVPEVPWRRTGFAVVVASKPGAR